MRNRYSNEFKDFIRENITKYTLDDLKLILEDKFKIKMSKDGLRRYINRHIKEGKYKDYNKNNVRDVYRCSIGTERVTDEGVFIKIKEPDVWRRKSRVMYEKYYKCKLDDKDYIIFLNQDNTDFRKENLIKSSQREIAYLHNNKTFSSNPELTKTGILSAKLMIKIKEMSKC